LKRDLKDSRKQNAQLTNTVEAQAITIRDQIQRKDRELEAKEREIRRKDRELHAKEWEIQRLNRLIQGADTFTY